LATIRKNDGQLKTLSPEHLDILISRAKGHDEVIAYLQGFQRAAVYEYLRRMQYEILHVPLHTLLEPKNESIMWILKQTYLLLNEKTEESKDFEIVLNGLLKDVPSTVELVERVKVVLQLGLAFLPELQMHVFTTALRKN
jgi:hypothetical protein